METALHKNRLVPVGVFQRQKTMSSKQANCPVCGENLFVSAANSVVKPASFNHYAHRDEDSRCSLSYQYHPTYSWLKNVPQELSAERAALLKHDFFQPDNLRRAFTFLTSLTGKGAVTSPVFSLLLRKADEFGIWRYSGLPVWAVPYILLTFIDFVVRPTAKPVYVLRFIVEKPPRSKLTTTWLQPGQCRLAKYFVNKGKANKLFGKVSPGKAPLVSARNPNPLTFSEAEFNRITADTSWIGDGLNHLLEEMQMAPEDERDGGDANAPVTAAPSLASKSSSAKKDILRPTPGQAPMVATTVTIPPHGVASDSDVIRQSSDDARVAEGARRPAYQHPTLPAVGRPPVQPAPLSSPPPSPLSPLSPPLPPLKPLLPPQTLPTRAIPSASVPPPLETRGSPTIARSPQQELGDDTVLEQDGRASISSVTASPPRASRLEPQANSQPPAEASNQSNPVKASLQKLSPRDVPVSRIWRWVKSFFR